MMQARPIPSSSPWLGWIVIGLLAGLAGLAFLLFHASAPGVKGRSVARMPTTRVAQALPPPPVVPNSDILPISATEAKAINAQMAISTAPLEKARPFLLPPASKDADMQLMGGDLVDGRDKALDCLTTAIFYEAASESDQGERAVAQVVLNRVRHPAFPKSICGVVYQGAERTTGCQFSFTCNGALARQPSQAGWERARRIALAALNGAIEPAVGTATHYHTDWVVPYWASSLDKVTMIGAHIFYRWKGYWGRRVAFTGAYAGETDEAFPTKMAYQSAPDQGADAATAETDMRPLGAPMGHMASTPERVAQLAPKPRADENRATLIADQQPHLLDEARLRGGSSDSWSAP